MDIMSDDLITSLITSLPSVAGAQVTSPMGHWYDGLQVRRVRTHVSERHMSVSEASGDRSFAIARLWLWNNDSETCQSEFRLLLKTVSAKLGAF